MPSWFHSRVKIWPKHFKDAPKSAQGADQEPPEKRPRGILEPTGAHMFSAFEQFWHKIKDSSDQEPPETRPQWILEPDWAERASKVRASMHHEITLYFNVSLKRISKRNWTKFICWSKIELNKTLAKHILCWGSRNMENHAYIYQKSMQNQVQVIVS